MKKYLIAGLGNIGAEYAETRHNIGFKILDALAGASNISFKTDRYADVAYLKVKNKELVLIKPSTYMNLSGKAINYWLQHEKIPLQNLLVVVDEIALPFGAIRLKGKGSDGGHNGLKSINQILGRQDYPRLRFGIGNDYPKGGQVNYVLGEWEAQEITDLKPRIELSCGAIETFALAGLNTAMNEYNKK
ncbi:aminoacyl-tRNA hydrolase [Owenweeksia hongkongensis]|uniref:aminoacyl-tRNA hydrolase n=1 Tax=Owenweeksia hongkongensis TaxID=253245 RepID=UPI003A8EC0B9